MRDAVAQRPQIGLDRCFLRSKLLELRQRLAVNRLELATIAASTACASAHHSRKSSSAVRGAYSDERWVYLLSSEANVHQSSRIASSG